MGSQSSKAVYISVKIYAAIMVKVTFEIKKRSTGRSGDLFFCDAGDRKRTIF